MEVTNVVVVAVGFSGLIAILVLYFFDPLKWKLLKRGADTASVEVVETSKTKEERISQFSQKQKDCSPLADFIRGGRNITFVGPTLDVVMSEQKDTLKNASEAEGTESLQFILLDPVAEQALQNVAERRKRGTTAETIRLEIYRSLNAAKELRTLSANPDKISVRLMQHVPLLSIVAVDPSSPTGKIRTSTHRAGIKVENRLVDDLYPEDSLMPGKYGVAFEVYDLALRKSDPAETKLNVSPQTHPPVRP